MVQQSKKKSAKKRPPAKHDKRNKKKAGSGNAITASRPKPSSSAVEAQPTGEPDTDPSTTFSVKPPLFREQERLRREERIAQGNREARAGENARARRDYEQSSTSIAQQALRMRRLVERVQQLEHTRDALVNEFFRTDDGLRDLERVKQTLNEEILTLERKIRSDNIDDDANREKHAAAGESEKFALTAKLLDDANYRNESLIDELQNDKAAWHEMRRAKVGALDERKRAARLRRKRVQHDKQQIEAMLAERNSNEAQLRTLTRERETLQNYVQMHGSKWLNMLGSPEDFLDRLALNRHIFLLRKRIEQQRQATLALHEEFESTSKLRRMQLERSCTTLFELVANARLEAFTNSVSVATRGAINYVLKRSLPLLQQEFVEQQISCLQDELETEQRKFDVFTARLRVEHLKMTHKLWTAKVQVHAIHRRKERQQAEKIAQVMRAVEYNEDKQYQREQQQQHGTSDGGDGDRSESKSYYGGGHDFYYQRGTNTAHTRAALINRDVASSGDDENERLINDVLKRTRNDAVLGVDLNALGSDDDDRDWIPNVHGSQDSD